MNLPKFKSQQLKDSAFIHRSFLNEKPELHLSSNERLEFLGDAILSFIVSDYLYQNFPKHKEGDLTSFRAALVRTEALADLSQKLDLGKYLKLSRGEEEGGGRQNPSILANTAEALIGALYLDQGLEAVRQFVEKNLLPNLTEIIKSQAYKDAKSLLQERAQETKQLSPVYRVLKTEGPDHAKIFHVGVFIQEKLIGTGKGASKQKAEQEAAKMALEKSPNF
ncbi:ribonuclease III [Candidatus Microgenomates bacterium]|nr:ribonuclease III [Candidatus Microgenomates bacterium]